jgi:transposase
MERFPQLSRIISTVDRYILLTRAVKKLDWGIKHGTLPCMNPRSRSWKEARRLQAWHLKQQGWTQRQIAEALGVSAGAVSQWMTRARQGGEAALRARPSPGAPRRLTPEQLTRLPTLLERGPEAYGFRGHMWTLKRVAEVIRREWGVVYHYTDVGRLLNAICWSLQEPMRQARKRNEAAIARWREATWPSITRGRKPTTKRSYS